MPALLGRGAGRARKWWVRSAGWHKRRFSFEIGVLLFVATWFGSGVLWSGEVSGDTDGEKVRQESEDPTGPPLRTALDRSARWTLILVS